MSTTISRWIDASTKWGIEWGIISSRYRGWVVQNISTGKFVWRVVPRKGGTFTAEGECDTVDQAKTEVESALASAE